MMDGATGWQRFWRVTLPQLRPTLFTVLTLGLIGCWQVFDQIYTGTQGGPAKTTLTPAYLSYDVGVHRPGLGPGRRDRVHPLRRSSSPSRSSSAGCCASAPSPSGVPRSTRCRQRHRDAKSDDRSTATAPTAADESADTSRTTPPRSRARAARCSRQRARGASVADRALRAAHRPRADLHLSVPRAGRDVVQDRRRGRGRPDLADPADLFTVGGVRAAVHRAATSRSGS